MMRIPDPNQGALAPVAGDNDVLSWWPEAAMLHGITFSDGKAVAYRNRWVRTKRWVEHQGADSSRHLDASPNVNVIKHGIMG